MVKQINPLGLGPLTIAFSIFIGVEKVKNTCDFKFLDQRIHEL